MLRKFILGCCAFAMLGFASLDSIAQPSAPAPVPASSRLPGKIQVAMVSGQAFAMSLGDTTRAQLKKGDSVFEGQVITTAKDASLILAFSTGATVNLGGDSILSIDEFLQDPFATPLKIGDIKDEPTTSSTRLNLLRGELISNVKKLKKESGSSFSVQTAVGAAGIRGTTFRLMFRPQGNRADFALTMIEGVIELAFGNRPSVTVEGGKELVLTGIEIDSSGKVISLPPVGRPTDVSAATRAALMSAVQQLLEAGAATSFSPTAAALAPTTQSGVRPSTPVSDPVRTPETTRSENDNAPTASPAPPPATPLPRTTPGEGAP